MEDYETHNHLQRMFIEVWEGEEEENEGFMRFYYTSFRKKLGGIYFRVDCIKNWQKSVTQGKNSLGPFHIMHTKLCKSELV